MIEKFRRDIHESWSSEEVFLAKAEEKRELKYVECLLLPRHVTFHSSLLRDLIFLIS